MFQQGNATLRFVAVHKIVPLEYWAEQVSCARAITGICADYNRCRRGTVQIAGQAVKITRTESHQNWQGKPNTAEGVSLMFYSGKSVYQVMETVNGVKINDKAREVAKQGWDRIRVAVK